MTTENENAPAARDIEPGRRMPGDGFSNPRATEGYVERTLQQVPGLEALHRMASVLLAERVPEEGRVLVLGAGGGLELKAFAQAHPGWRFDGVDPSRDMLDVAARTMGPLAARARLHVGFIESAPDGPFDGAACFLTFHHVPSVQERLRTLGEIRKRLKPGAPLVVAHLSIPQGPGQLDAWLARYAAFGALSNLPMDVRKFKEAMQGRLTLLTPEEDEALLRDAGFEDVALFYAAFTFRGWVACA